MTTRNIRSIEQTLIENLPWNAARIKFVTRFLLALFTVQTVNLSSLATAFSGTAKDDSNYKRLQRFFREFEMPYEQLTKFIVVLLGIPAPFTLALDRTNWKVGAASLNILMLSIVYRGIGVPIIWIMLDKEGASNTKERIELMEKFLKLYGPQHIECLLGDREFVGKLWFQFLKRNRIKFIMRLRQNTIVINQRGKKVQIWKMFSNTRINCPVVFSKTRRILDMDLYLSGCKLKSGEFLILASADFFDNPAEEYKKRWGIETLFGSLKTRGFNLEDTRLQDPQRLSRLLALLTIAFTWAFVVGIWQAAIKGLKLKKHGYFSKSIFRMGFKTLCRLFTNIEQFDRDTWRKVIKILSCS